MAVINDNFTVRAPVPVDDRKGWWDGSDWQPFTSRQDALDKTPYYRYRTLTLPVVENGDVVEYWFKTGVEDSDFVLKTSQVDLSNYYTKTELQTSGQAQVHWDNITNVPDLSVLWENIGGDQLSVEVGGFSNTIGYITGVSWGDITGSQSVIGNAGFTNDAGYITAADLPSPLTFENGLREDNGVVKLGLDLSTIGTTNSGAITEDLFLTRLDGSGNPYYQVIFGVDSLPGLYFTHVSDTSDPSNVQSGLVLSNNQAILSRNNSSGGQSLNIGLTNNMVVSDTINMKGLEEPADYSANKTQYSYVTLKMLQDAIPELTGYATEQWVLDQNYLSSISSSWNINTGDLTIQGNVLNLDGRYMLRSNTITSGYGITASGDFTNAVNIEVDTSTLDNRYLRKDVNDSNDTFNLALGTLDAGNTLIDGTFTLSSIATGLITDEMVVRDAATGLIKSIAMPNFGGTFTVANNAGTPQFTVDSGDILRFNATGDASIAFNAGTKTITINSSGGSSGGGVDSWNARTGVVSPESGDYYTDMVPERGGIEYFTQARVRNTSLTGFNVLGDLAIVSTDNIVNAFGKVQGQINARVPTSRQITINGTSGNITVGGGNTQNLASNPSWTVNLATVGTAGTYTKVVTDAYGRVTAGGALTVSDLPPSVMQTLSTGNWGQMGYVSISGGNNIAVGSLSLNRSVSSGTPQDMIDEKWSLSNNSGLFTYSYGSGSSGFNGSLGSGIVMNRYSGTTNKTGFIIDRPTYVNDKLYYANIVSNGEVREWQTFASESWVLDQIPTNYVTTNTTQTGLTGNKYWDGAARWAPTGTASSKSASIGIGAGTSGVWLQGWQNSSATTSFLLRGYATDGIQFELDEGGINFSSQNLLYSNGNRILAVGVNTNLSGPTTGSSVYLRPNGSGSTTGQAILSSTGSLTLRGYIDAPVTSTVADGPYYAGGNVILGANTTGGTVVAAQSDTVYLRPNGASSGTNQAQFGSNITLSALTGSGTQMVTVNASGVLGRQSIPAVGVTSVAAGNGMNFTTITGTGSVTLGTPGTLTSSTSNSVSSTSHTHALGQTVFISMGSLGSTNLNDITQAGNGAQTTAAEATAARNYPITGNGGTLISTAAVNNYRTQFFNERAANRMFWRGFNGSSWSAWKEFWHDGNLTNPVTYNTGTYPQLEVGNSWVRTPTNGLLPSVQGGSSALGSTNWPFNNIYGNNIYEGGTALSSKYALASRSITAGTMLSGGGNLSANRTINFAPGGTTSQYIRGNGTLATFPTIPTVNNGTLTMATGDGLSGSDTFSANQSSNTTFTVSLTNIAAGSSSVGALRYNGTSRSSGRLYGGSTDPNASTRLNYNGILHAYDFVGYGTSDKRFKENIVPIVNPLEKLSHIGGYSFKWKDGHDSYQGNDYGVIAQEVEKVLPEIVSERGGVKAIKTGNQLTGLLIAGFNELVKRVEALENGIS